MTTQIEQAAERGPGALIEALERVLSRRPELARDPKSASDLAHVTASAAAKFRGANLPVYRRITARIVDAAPESLRPEIAKSVADAVALIALRDPLVRQPFLPGSRLAGRQDDLGRAAAQRGRRTGVKVGSFVLYPEIEVTEFYDDNIFATSNRKVDDFATVISPQLIAVSNWDKHWLKLEAHTDIVKYASNDDEDSIDYWFASEGRYDIGEKTKVFGGVLYGQFHEDRESPDDVAGIEPTNYTEVRSYLGGARSFGLTTLRVGGSFERTEFENTTTSAAVVNNGDRDRNHITAGPRVEYKLSKVFQPYFEALADFRRYDSSVDDNGFDRDSRGYRTAVGTHVSITAKLEAEIFGGYLRQDYDDPSLPDVSAVEFGGNARWRVVPSTLVTFWIDRSVEETTLFSASSYLFTGGGAKVEYDVTSKLVLTLRGLVGYSDFRGNPRIDRDYEGSLGVRYRFNQRFFAAADYRFQRRNSNVDQVDYGRHQIFLRAGFRY